MQITASSQSIQALAQGVNSSSQSIATDNVANFCSVLDSVMVTTGNDKSLSANVSASPSNVKNSSSETKVDKNTANNRKGNTKVSKDSKEDSIVKTSKNGKSTSNTIKSKNENSSCDSKSIDQKSKTVDEITDNKSEIKDSSDAKVVLEDVNQDNEDLEHEVKDIELSGNTVKETESVDEVNEEIVSANISLQAMEKIESLIDDKVTIDESYIPNEETSNASNNSISTNSEISADKPFVQVDSNINTSQSLEKVDVVSQSQISDEVKQIDLSTSDLKNSIDKASSLAEDAANVEDAPLAFMDLLKTSRSATTSVNVTTHNDVENVESLASTVLQEVAVDDAIMNEENSSTNISLDELLPQEEQYVELVKPAKTTDIKNPISQVNTQSTININSLDQNNTLVGEENDLIKLQENVGNSQITSFAENLKKLNSSKDSTSSIGRAADINIQIKSGNSSEYVTSDLSTAQTTNKVPETFGSSSFNQNDQLTNNTINSLNTIQGSDFKAQLQEKTQMMNDQLQKAIHLSKDIEENVRQLSEKLNIMIARNMKEAELNLDPVGLGKMKITINMSDDGIARVNMVVQQGETKDIINDSMSRLKSYFEQQGLTLGESSVEHQESWGDRSQNSGSNQTNGQTSAKIDNLIEGSAENEGITISVSSSEQAVDYFA